jgi:hypothetical protein
MTFEEMQRAMELMVEHGARTDARLEVLSEPLASLRESVNVLREEFQGLREQFRESHGTLTASMKRLIELMQQSDGRYEAEVAAEQCSLESK